jgi:hypothetical protein
MQRFDFLSCLVLPPVQGVQGWSRRSRVSIFFRVGWIGWIGRFRVGLGFKVGLGCQATQPSEKGPQIGTPKPHRYVCLSPLCECSAFHPFSFGGRLMKIGNSN